jgi:hypothetical protein
LIKAARDEKRQVSRCWHPEAVGQTVEAKNGSNIAVIVCEIDGVPGYQLSDGEIVTLQTTSENEQ